MADARRRHFTGTPWEAQVGYCRALRVGDRIVVSGTLGVDADARPAGDAYGQSKAALARIVEAVETLGGSAGDIVRTRIYATDVARDFPAIGRAHAEIFADSPPASTMIGIAALAVDGCVVEIEAEAVVAGDESGA